MGMGMAISAGDRRTAMRITGHRNRLTSAHLELMGIPYRFWDSSMDRVPECDGKGAIRKYLVNLDAMIDQGNGLLLWGDNGHGKTSAAVVVAKEARRRGASVLFITAERLRKASLNDEMFNDDRTVFQRAMEVELLVLDDLGKEYSGDSGYTERLFESIIRERAADKRTTVVTTNMAPSPRTDSSGKAVHCLSDLYKKSMIEVMKECLFVARIRGDNLRDVAQNELAQLLAASG
jgi:DNA replication protein DnaC